MTKFAYIGKDGILHVSGNAQTAKEKAINGKVVKTEHPAGGGYPIVAGEEIIVYSPERMSLKGLAGKEWDMPENAQYILNPKDYPTLVTLYKQCM